MRILVSACLLGVRCRYDGAGKAWPSVAARQKRHIGEVLHCELSILKAQSPSCGSGKIYDGSFFGKLTAALLKSQGLRVITEEELTGGESVPSATEKRKLRKTPVL